MAFDNHCVIKLLKMYLLSDLIYNLCKYVISIFQQIKWERQISYWNIRYLFALKTNVLIVKLCLQFWHHFTINFIWSFLCILSGIIYDWLTKLVSLI